MAKASVIFLLVSSIHCEKIECTFDYQSYNVLGESLSLWACLTSVFLKGLQNIEISTENVNATHTNANVEVFAFVDSEIDYIPIEIFKRFPDLIVFDASYTSLPILKENTFEGANKLKALVLSNNKIKQLSSFNGLTELVELNLSHNRIKTLSVFKKLFNLRVLDLKGNEIIVIDKDAFQHLANLTKLQLSQNWILQVDDEFKDLKILEELDLSENRIKKINENSFKGLKDLKSLHIGQNAITELDETIFKDLVNLQFLYLQNNRMFAVAPSLLANLKLLQVFDLSENRIDHLDKELFANQRNLIDLNLSRNTLSKIEDGSFENLEKLERLNLRILRKFSEVTNATFKGLVNLQVLTISHNNVKDIPIGAFDDLGKLLYLSMEGTKQASVSAEVMKPLKSLIKLDLPYDVRTISPFAMNNFKELVFLHLNMIEYFKEDLTILGFNYLKKFEPKPSEDKEVFVKLEKNSCQTLHLKSRGDISTYSIEADEFAVLITLSYPDSVRVLKIKNVRIDVDHHGVFKNQKVLEELYINDCTLSNITIPLLTGLTNLKALDLSKSKIMSIEDHSFDDLVNLKLLQLKKNQIDFTNTQLLTYLRNLQGLFLDDNKMNNIDQEFLSKNILLKEVYLQNMQIGSIDVNSFQNLKELKVLNIRGNRLIKLSHSVFKGLTRLVSIDLSENKLNLLSIDMFAQVEELKELKLTENCCNYNNFDYFDDDGHKLDRLKNSFAELSCDQCSEEEIDSNTGSCLGTVDSSIKRTCKGNEEWSSFSEYNCRKFQYIGEQEKLECETGYKIFKNSKRRSNKLTCLKSGKWNKKPIICNPICSTKMFETSMNHAVELYVNLKHVPFQRVSLGDLENIEKITIQHKYEKDNEFTAYTEFSLPDNVKKLSIKNTKFIQAAVISNQTNLEELYLNSNEISHLHKHLLTGLVNLQIADFSGSQIETIEDYSFDDLIKLHTLKLYNNKINFAQTKLFRKLDNLKFIYLSGSGNILKTIDREIFENTKSLEEIEMKYMLIEKINEGSFTNLNKLKTLNFYANRIAYLSETVFDGLQSLTSLILRNNAIKFLSPKTFSSMTNLFELDLWDNVCIYNKWNSLGFLKEAEETISNSTCIGCTVDDLGKFGHGVELVFGNNFTIGDRVQNLQTLNIVCDSGYDFVKKDKDDDIITCADNKWNKKFPLCIELCPGNETGGYTTQSKCSFKGERVSCNKNQAPETLAEITCAVGYQLSKNATGSQLLTCLEGGKWDLKPVKCTPICGRISAKSVPLIVGGETTDIKLVPWQVAIYKMKANKSDYKLQCGGTILTKKIVLSSSHCFYLDRDKELVRFPLEDFNIVVGKFYRLYTANETYPTQNFSIAELRTIPSYKGYSGFYISDFALIVLEGSIEFQTHILPICIDFNVRYGLDRLVSAGEVGLAAGWGNTKAGGIPSKVLKSIEMPVVDFGQCRREAGDFEPFVTPDKFCSGYLNGSGLCSGLCE